MKKLRSKISLDCPFKCIITPQDQIVSETRIANIRKEFEKNKVDFPGIRRTEALKRAIIKAKLAEQTNYSDNGPIVDGLIGSHNPSDWTY